MANLRFPEAESSTQDTSAVFSNSNAESVHVSQKVEKNERVLNNIAMMILPFFLVIAVAMGGVFYQHSRWVAGQKALSDRYRDSLEWRTKARQACDELRPYFAKLRAIDPSKPQDWKKIDADRDKIKTLIMRPLVAAPPNLSNSEYDVQGEASKYISRCDIYVQTSELPHQAKTNSFRRTYIRALVAENLARQFSTPDIRDLKGRERDWTAALAKAKGIVVKMSDEEVARRVWAMRSPWPSSAHLEDLLNSPVEIPRGLDLEFARRNGLLAQG